MALEARFSDLAAPLFSSCQSSVGIVGDIPDHVAVWFRLAFQGGGRSSESAHSSWLRWSVDERTPASQCLLPSWLLSFKHLKSIDWHAPVSCTHSARGQDTSPLDRKRTTETSHLPGVAPVAVAVHLELVEGNIRPHTFALDGSAINELLVGYVVCAT